MRLDHLCKLTVSTQRQWKRRSTSAAAVKVPSTNGTGHGRSKAVAAGGRRQFWAEHAGFIRSYAEPIKHSNVLARLIHGTEPNAVACAASAGPSSSERAEDWIPAL